MLRVLGGILVVLTLTSGRSARADSWLPAQIKEVFSQSREWFVRVTPGDSLGDTVGFAGSPKGKPARAEFYRRARDRSYRLTQEITLHNPVAPVMFLVTDRGYLVTFDNWHNMGFGKVIVSYSPAGRVVFAGELKDLFWAEEIAMFREERVVDLVADGNGLRTGRSTVSLRCARRKRFGAGTRARNWTLAVLRMARRHALVPRY